MSYTILIIDGQVAVRQIVQHALHKAGYKTTIVDNATQAMIAIEQQKPDAIIMDDQLEDMSGGKLCRQIKNESKTQHIPIVMHSQGLRMINPEYVKATGADVALTKPVAVEVVLKAVRSVLRSTSVVQG